MTTTKELLTKITALRGRLERLQPPSLAVAEKPPAEAVEEEPAAPTRLTFRAAQLLKNARVLLAELKDLADEPAMQNDESIASTLQREAAGLLDVVMRNLAAIPEGAAAQLRHCEGLQSCLAAARDKVSILQQTLEEERRDDQQVEMLATLLRRLATGEEIGLGGFMECARGIADGAILGLPLGFRSHPKGDVARFAAHHGLTVARVQAWVLRGEIPQRQRLAEALIPALIHDVGMLFVPAHVVFKTGPLNDAERALVREHTGKGRELALTLYPGGGWPVDAVADHHEYVDGTGYFGKNAESLDEPARLLAVCDVYAALASPRPYRPAHDPRTALADTLMLADQGRLDRVQAEKLLRLTFYPAGSVVQLSDGTVALVVGSPKVLVNPAKATVIPLRTPTGTAPAYPWPIDLAESHSLNILRALTLSERVQVLGRTHPALV